MHIYKTVAAAIFAVFFLLASVPARAGDDPTLLGFEWRFDPAKSLRANLNDDSAARGGDAFRLTGVLGGGGEAAFAAAQGGSWLTFGLTIAGAAGATYLLVCSGDETVTATAGTDVYDYRAYTATGTEAVESVGRPDMDSALGLVFAYGENGGDASSEFYASDADPALAVAVTNDAGDWYVADTPTTSANRYTHDADNNALSVGDNDIGAATPSRVVQEVTGTPTAASDHPNEGDAATAPVERTVTTRKKRDKC